MTVSIISEVTFTDISLSINPYRYTHYTSIIVESQSFIIHNNIIRINVILLTQKSQFSMYFTVMSLNLFLIEHTLLKSTRLLISGILLLFTIFQTLCLFMSWNYFLMLSQYNDNYVTIFK